MSIDAELRAALYNTKEWRAARARVIERAGGRCECRGECGRAHFVRLEPDGPVRRRGARCWERGDRKGIGDGVEVDGRVSLGAAHRNHDTGKRVPDAQLVALCSGCHLRYDVEQHLRSRHTNRRKRLEKRGQRSLLT